MDVVKPGKYQHGPATCKLRYSPVIPSNLRGHMLEITSIFTPESERRKGYASEMLREICQQASREGKALMLMPDNRDLATWYARHGFEIVQQSPLLMARQA